VAPPRLLLPLLLHLQVPPQLASPQQPQILLRLLCLAAAPQPLPMLA
jgi:hypothetical protein